MLALCISLLGMGGSVYALQSAVSNLRPSNGLPKFFPEDSNLGGLQELQMRFGNETSIESTELKLCHGRAQDAKLACDGESRPTPTVVPPTEPPPLHLPGNFKPAAMPRPSPPPSPPLPHPPLTPPSQNHPPRPQPTRRPAAASQRPSRPVGPSSASGPSAEAVGGFDLQLEVKGHSSADIQEFEDLVRDQIVESLQLSPEDLSFDIKKVKVLDGRRLQGQYEVTLHFHHVTPEKASPFLWKFEVEHCTLAASAAAPPTQAAGNACNACDPAAPNNTTLFLSRTDYNFTDPCSRGVTSGSTTHAAYHRSSNAVEADNIAVNCTCNIHISKAFACAQLSNHGGVLEFEAQHDFHEESFNSTGLSPVDEESRLAPPSALRNECAMQLHLQPRGMPHDRLAVIHVLLGVREVRGVGSAYAYELDPTFDLSRREAQLAIVDFCQRLRQEAQLKVVKGQWSCWPSKLKADFTCHDFLLLEARLGIWKGEMDGLLTSAGRGWQRVLAGGLGRISQYLAGSSRRLGDWQLSAKPNAKKRRSFKSTKEDTAQRVFDEVTKKYRGRGRNSQDVLAGTSAFWCQPSLKLFDFRLYATRSATENPADVTTFASKFLSESDDTLEHMAMTGLSAKQLLNSLQLGICVIDSCSLQKAAGESGLQPADAVKKLQDLGLKVILIVYDDDEVESQPAGLLLHRASLDDGAEVARVAAEYECAFAVPARAGEASWPWTLQMEYKHWVQAAASLCEVHFTVESSGNFTARLPEAMKKHLRKLRYQKHPEVSRTKQPQPQDFKEPLQWDAGQAFVVTVTRGERHEWLLCIGELEDAAILQEASHLASYLLGTHGADSWIEREDDPSISDALCEIGGLWGASRSTLLTAASGPHAGLRGLGIGSNKKLRQRAALLALAATAFAQWGSEEPLPGSAASLKTLATAVRETLQPEGKKGAEGQISRPLSDLFQRAEAFPSATRGGQALVALGAFTRSLWLSVTLSAQTSTCQSGFDQHVANRGHRVLRNAVHCLFFITNIFQWRFGLMEAVSLIIFCGFSVDYPLHVVQAYVQERSKGAPVEEFVIYESGFRFLENSFFFWKAVARRSRFHEYSAGRMIALPPKVPPPLLTSGDEAEQDGTNAEETAEVLADQVTCIPVTALSFAKLAEDLRQLQEQLVEAHAREVSLASSTADGRRSSMLSVRSTASAPGISLSPCSAQSLATGQGKDRSSFSLKKDADSSDFMPVSPSRAACSKGPSLPKRSQSGGPGERSALMPRPSRHEGADVDANTEAPVALTVRKSLMVEDAKTMSRSVAEQARRLSNNLEEQVLEELENVPTSCQLRGEWAISDEDLVELKKRTIKCSPTKRSTGSAHWSYLPPSQRVYFHAGEVMLSEDAQPWILRPSSKPRLVWDVLALVVIVYDLVTVPLQVFQLDAAFHETKRGLQLFTTVFWLLDIPTNFLTAVYINGALQVDPYKIARAYSRSWLCFDILVLVPDVMAIVEGAQDAAEGTESIGLLRAARTGRLLRLVRFLRILRLAKLLQVLGSLSARINHEMALLAFGITKMIFLTAYLGHLLSCLWFAVGDVEDGWVYTKGLNGAPFHLQYLTSLEWALSRIHPSAMQNNMSLQTGPERALAIAASFLALGVSSLFISSITNTMADINRERQRKKQILYSVRDYCGSHRISSGHTLRIKQYVEREHHRKKTQQLHLELLETLPKDMLFELFHEGRSQALQHHSLFDRLGRIDPVMELNFCNKVLAELHVMTLDKVFKSEDTGKAMYIPAAGQYNYEYLPPNLRAAPAQPKHSKMRRLMHRLSLRSTESKVWPTEVAATTTAVGPGDCLSEYCLWVDGWKHRGNLQAAVDGRLISVQVSEIGKFLQDFPATLVDTALAPSTWHCHRPPAAFRL
ncbi:KCNH6 [Symbiodinium sp. CCMP2456]|nr:KCNH6 [Symbiodinium sp. CCMP2456]